MKKVALFLLAVVMVAGFAGCGGGGGDGGSDDEFYSPYIGVWTSVFKTRTGTTGNLTLTIHDDGKFDFVISTSGGGSARDENAYTVWEKDSFYHADPFYKFSATFTTPTEGIFAYEDNRVDFAPCSGAIRKQ